MKKVLFVAHVESHILNFHTPFLKLFNEYGYEVHVATNGSTEIPYCDYQHNLPFQRSPLAKDNLTAYRELKKIINNFDFDIVHCHTPVGGVLSRLACHFSDNKEHTKVYYTAHGFHFFKGAPLINWLLYYPIEKLMAHFTDVLITINEEDYQRAQKFSLKLDGKVYKVNGVGIDIKALDSVYVDVSTKRKELGVKDNDILLVTAGEMNKNKNQKIIIEAMSSLKDKDNIKLVLCGSGSLNSQLVELTNQLKLTNRVIFAGYRNDLVEILKTSDMFIFPSYREGLSVALMQAISCNLPCAVSNIRGNVDLIKCCKNGYTFNPSDSRELAEIIKNHNFAKGKATRNNDIYKYDINYITNQMKNIYGLGGND